MNPTPKDQLRSMLESTNRLDTSGDPPSPLESVDPKALDEFFSRLDSDLKLGNVPNPEDRAAVIQYYRNLRLRFLADERASATKTPKPRKASVNEILKGFSL